MVGRSNIPATQSERLKSNFNLQPTKNLFVYELRCIYVGFVNVSVILARVYSVIYSYHVYIYVYIL